MSERKSVLKLTTKMHTGFGFASFILGLLSVIFFISAVFISAFEDRNMLSIQYRIGIIEIFAILFSLVGITYGVVGETTKDTYKLYAHLGLSINFLAIIFHVLVIYFSL